MADQQLTLKIGGDSVDAVSSVQDVLDILRQTLSDVTSSSEAMTSSVSQAMGGLTEQMTIPFDGLKEAAAASSEAAGFSISGMFEGMTAAAGAGLAEIGGTLEGFGEKVKSAVEDPLKTAKDALSGFLEEMGPVGVGLAAVGATVGAIGTALFELADKAAETGERIQEFAYVTGTAVDKISAMQAGAEIAGGSLDSMQSMLTQMTRRLDATGPAAEKMNAALRDLSINSDEFRRADPSDRIAILSEGMQKAKGSTTLMSDALAIMGRSGVSNIGFLMKYTDEARESGEALAATWTQQDLTAAEELGYATRTTGVEFQTLTTTMGQALIPAATEAVQVFNRTIVALERIADLGGLVSGAWRGYTDAIGNLAAREAAAGAVMDTTNRLLADARKKGMDYAEALEFAANEELKRGYTIATVAAQLGISADKVKELAKAQKDAKTDAENFTAGWEALNKAASEGKPTMDGLSESTKGLIVYYNSLGKTATDIAPLLKVSAGAAQLVIDAHTKGQQAAEGYAKKLEVLNSAMFGEKQELYTLLDWYGRNNAALEDNADAADRFAQKLIALQKGGAELPAQFESYVKAMRDFNDSLKEYDILTDIRKTSEKEALKQSTDEWTKWATDQNVALGQATVAHLKGALQIKTIGKDIFDFQNGLTETARDKQIAAIQDWESAQEAAFTGTDDQWQEYYDKLQQLTEDKLGAIDVNWSELAASSKRNLQEIADKDWATYVAALADSDNYSAAAIANFKRIAEKAQEAADGTQHSWSNMLDETFNKDLPSVLTKAFEGGGGIMGAVQGLGTKMGSKLGSNLSQSLGDDLANTGENTLTNMFGDKVGGALTAAMPAIGSMIGPAIGALTNFIVGLFDHSTDDLKKIGHGYGVALTDAMVKTIKDTMASLHITEQAATILNASALFPVVDATNFSAAVRSVHDAFSMVETKQLSVAQGAKVVDDMWSKLVTAGTDATGLLNKQMTDLIKLNDQFGTNSKQIADYLATQEAAALTGIGGAVKVTSDAYAKLTSDQLALKAAQEDLAHSSGSQADALQRTIDALKADSMTQLGIIDATSVKTESVAEAMGATVAAAFDQDIASGKTFAQAIADVGPTVDNLTSELMAAGLHGGAAFDMIRAEVDLSRDAIAGPALNAVNSLSSGMVALSNMGRMNQDTFESLASQIGSTFDSLVRQGKDGSAVMIAMQGPLQTLWEEQQQFGYKVDDSTQALIDEAVKAGEVGPAHKSSTDQMIDALKTLHTDLQGIVSALTGSGGVSDAYINLASKAKAAISSIPDHKTFTLTEVVEGPDFDSVGAGTAKIPSFDHRPMEQVTSAGLALLHPGDVVGVPPSGLGGPRVSIYVAGSVWTEADLADAVGQRLAQVFSQRGGAMPLGA